MHMKKGIAKRITMFLGIMVMFLLLMGCKEVKASSPAIEIRKESYDEVNNQMVIGIYLKAGTTLNHFAFDMSYTSDVEIIPYGTSARTGTANDWELNNFADILIDSNGCSYGGGIVSIDSETLANEITTASDQQLCKIKFQLSSSTTVLEEDTILNSLFSVDAIEVADDTNTDSDLSLAQINNMAKTLTSITLTNPIFDKDPYKHGDTVNLIGGTATLNYSNAASIEGATRTVDLATMEDTNGNTINITKPNCTADYNNPQNVYVSYKEKNSNTVAPNVVDYIEEITLTKPSKTEYEYGEDLDISDAKVDIKMASKTTADEKTLQELIDDQKATVSGFNSKAGPNEEITQTVEININYDGYELEDSYDVTIKDKIKEITFQAPSKTEYEYNEANLDLSGGKIIIEMLSSNDTGIKRERNLRNIPTYGSTGLLRSLNSTININDEIEITGFDSTKYGEETITVKYYYEDDGVQKDKTFTYKINIKAGITSKNLSNDNMTIPYGHDITATDLEDIKIVLNKTDNTKDEIDVTPDMITYNKYGDIGVQTGYVNYNGEQLPIYIELTNYVDYIQVNHKNITVLYGDDLGENTLTEEYKIIPIMANGEIGTTARLTKEKIVGAYNTNKEGTYDVKVNYLGKETDFKIIVVDPIMEIKLEDDEKDKIQLEYKYNEELNLNDAKLTMVKLSGETKINLTKEMVKNYDLQKIGLQKLNIQYSGYEIEDAFEVEVKDYIVDIILVKPNKTTYLPKEKLDLTGATVRTLSASGVLGDEVPVTFDMISGYKEDESGTQIIRVNYEGFEKTFEAIFTVQTGASNINAYTIFATIITISLIAIIAILAMRKREKINNKKT